MPGIGTALPEVSIGSWSNLAACADAPISERWAPSSIFFAENGRDPVSRLEVTQAKGICHFSCPVRIECLEYALAVGEDHGVYGGFTPRERKVILKQRRLLAG